MGFRKIDLATWPKANMFRFFTTMEQCVISLTCDVDVTGFVKLCREHHLKFYTAFICLLSKVVNNEECFRLGRDEDGNLIVFDSVNPFFTDSVPETNGFSSLKTDYSSDMKELYRRITEVREKYKGKEILMPDNMDENKFNITCVPWIHYKHLDLDARSRQDVLYPYISFGKYENVNGRLLLPLTLRINHAVCDGYLASAFYSETSRRMTSVIEEIVK